MFCKDALIYICLMKWGNFERKVCVCSSIKYKFLLCGNLVWLFCATNKCNKWLD